MSSPGYSSARLRPRRAGLRFTQCAHLTNGPIQHWSPRWIRHNISFTPDKAAAIDKEEDGLYGEDRQGDEMPEWVKDKQQRLERIRQAKAELEAEAKAAA